MDINLLRQIFDNIPQAVWVKDKNSVYLIANRSYAKYCNLKQEDFIGKTDHDVYPNRPDLANKYIRDDNEVLQTRKKIEFDEEAHFKDGVVNVHTVKTPVFDDNGEIMGVMGIAWDITKYKRLEHRLEEEKDNLEQSNKDLESFAYMASHDLQEPLRTISNYLQILDRKYSDKCNDKELRYIRLSIQGAQNMKKLIDNMLRYSRVSAKKPEKKFFEPHRLVAEVKRNLAATISNNNAKIHIDEMPEKAYGDPTQIQLVLQNLMHNALKYTNKKSVPQIRVSCVEKEDHYMFSVQDNGPGIQGIYLDKIFLGFRKFGQDDKEGVGLGLAICKKIVERHRGKIWVETELNKGSTFYFTIRKKQRA